MIKQFDCNCIMNNVWEIYLAIYFIVDIYVRIERENFVKTYNQELKKNNIGIYQEPTNRPYVRCQIYSYTSSVLFPSMV